MKKILVVEDDKNLRDTIIDFFNMKGEYVNGSDNVNDALKLVKQHDYEIVITDLNLKNSNGLELIKILKTTRKSIEIIVITGIASIDIAINAIKLGAFQYLTKPFKLDEIEVFVEKAYEKLGLEREIKSLKSKLIEKYNFSNIIYKSEKMNNIVDQVKQIAPTVANVLILGESGVGKELIAQAIHYNSNFKNGPFVPINCSAFPETLLESELFGYEKGAFTGAQTSRKGKFQLAEGGTLFLDEIGDISLLTQVKLLRFLEKKEVMPVGSNKVITINTRLVFATNKDLEKLVNEGKFREDFYYRINVVKIIIPPLRDRKDDIIALANYNIIQFCRQYQKPLMTIDKDALKALLDYTWPGNVRELKNVMEHIVIFNNKDSINIENIPVNIRANETIKKTLPRIDEGFLVDRSMEEIEKMTIISNLKKYKNNTKVAKVLGMSRASLINKIKKYNINKEEI
ncbi:sigma-54-dependent Fis family transcriptional regulator [bacterium]|nr:sigma-54-dependent Fis family transcriptional regulator [bacterium]